MTALLARLDEFPAGCDPDFDTDFELLEREFADLRLTFGHEDDLADSDARQP